MSTLKDHQINHYFSQLENEGQQVRKNATNKLGDNGDELCLQLLRENVQYLNKEHQTLIIAVGKLKKPCVYKIIY
ncbi:MAG: hypothetical protein JXB49_07100 [Bacteroidales bacterium]|nr:hypothetical protein [Bacteroidales bacterium]